MTSQYPARIDDNITLPVMTDNSSIVRASALNELRTALLAIESCLGVNPASVYGTVRERLAAFEAVIANINSGDEIIALGGDLSGGAISQTVIGLQGHHVSNTAPTNNYVLTWSTSSNAWVPAAAGSGFTAGGDISGTSTSQTVSKINGTTVTSSGGALVTGRVLRVTGTSSVDYGAVNLANTSAVTGVLPVANVAHGSNGQVLSTVSGVTTWTSPLQAGYEIVLASGTFTTIKSSFDRVGGRKIDLSSFPATVGALTRTVTFVANVDMTATATSVEIQLYDITHNVVITGTNLVSSSVVNVELNSGALTVGSSSGNMRSDVASQYTLQMKMNGGTVNDAVFCTNAMLIISYA